MEEKIYLPVGGINIHYKITGEGKKVIVFLHGNGENLSVFEKHSKFFSEKGYKVLSIDSRGHGESDLSENMTIRIMADDLYEIFNLLKIPKAHIVGFSDGANTAMVFASKHTERVDRLILFGGNMNPKGYKIKPYLQMWTSYQISRLAVKSDPINAPYMRLNHLMAKQPDITASELKNIKNAALVMAGSNDVVKESHTKYISECIENSQLLIMPGNHFIPLEKSGEFIQEIYKFLTK